MMISTLSFAPKISFLKNKNSTAKKIKTWKFATGFIFRKSKSDFVKKFFNEKYSQEMTDLGVWTRDNLIELGPTFIKFGQIASTRSDIFDENFVNEVCYLQDECPPIDDFEINEVISSEFYNNTFDYFDTKPFKAASIGQVHFAKIKGKDVVVKIQRPKIREIIQDDLTTIKEIIEFFTLTKIVNDYDSDIFDQSEKYLMQEVDYINESNNSETIRRNFKNNDNIIIPKVSRKYSSEHVLIMERVDSTKITSIKKSSDKKKAVKLLIDCFIKQILNDGYLHADPHPGNIGFVNDSIVMYDFGLTIDITNLIKDSFNDILLSLIERDAVLLTDILIQSKLIIPKSDKTNIVFFFQSIFELFPPIDNIENMELNVNETMETLQDLGYSDRNRPFLVSNDLIYLGKSLSLVDGICRKLDPEYKPLEYIKPYVVEKITDTNINFDGRITSIIEIPSKVKNMNKSIISIEKTSYTMMAKTKSINKKMKQTQGIIYILLLYIWLN